jgi:RNA ligase (TIGR02306 family)
MSTFEVKIYKLTVHEHPDAHSLEIAQIGDYNCIAVKNKFKTGDLAIYIPEASILPEKLLAFMGFWNPEINKGTLAGPDGNRVKAVRLRGVVSQGLLYPIYTLIDRPGIFMELPYGDLIEVDENMDFAELLGITKWEPPIPIAMAGEVDNYHGKTISYDIENFKKYPTVIADGEEVVMTEKTHGTWCCFGWHPFVGHPIITSKGLSQQGLIFKLNENNKNNLYIRAFNSFTENETTLIDRAILFFGTKLEPFYILGEVFGNGVQDNFTYGLPSGKIDFRLFDVYMGAPHSGRYLNFDEKQQVALALNIPMVPILYRGPFSKEIMYMHTDGKETLSGKSVHMREGTVVTPVIERYEFPLGRVILKSVSEAYILRKNGTEYN